MSYFVGFYDFSHGFPTFSPNVSATSGLYPLPGRAGGAVEDALAVVHGKGGVGDLSDDLHMGRGCYLH